MQVLCTHVKSYPCFIASFVRNYANTGPKIGHLDSVISRNVRQPSNRLKFSKLPGNILPFVCEFKTTPFQSSDHAVDNTTVVPTTVENEDQSEHVANNEFEGYDLEKLLHNIRQKASDRHLEVHHKTERDVHSLMTIGELANFLEAENAKDICVISVSPEKRYVDYLVVCSGSSTRHIRRMADALASEMRHVRISGDYDIKTDHRRVTVEGEESNDWMAVDIGNIVVHFMLDKTREIYQIEKLWTLGHEYDDMTREIQKFLDNEQV